MNFDLKPNLFHKLAIALRPEVKFNEFQVREIANKLRRYSLGSICDIDIPQLSEEIELKCAELKQELDDFDEDDRYFMVKKPSSIFPGETMRLKGI